jgi:hypothetical protein
MNQRKDLTTSAYGFPVADPIWPISGPVWVRSSRGRQATSRS